METKNKKGYKIIGLVVLILVLGFAGYFSYKMSYKEPEEAEKEIKEVLPYALQVYKQAYGYCIEKNDYCTEVAFSIPTKTEDTKVLAFDMDYLFVLFQDQEELKVYNKKTKKSQTIDLDLNYKEYKIYSDEDNGKIIGIAYKTKEDKIGYFNVDTKEKMYEGNYEITDTYQLNQINNKYLSVSVLDKEAYLLSTKEEKEELKYQGDSGPGYSFSSYGTDEYIFALNSCAGDCSILKLYSNDKKEIYDKVIFEQNIGHKNNIVYFSEENKIKKTDTDGNITDLKTFSNVKGIIDNYVIYVEDHKLKYENLETNGIKEICNWNNHYFYDFYTSKYYTKDKLDIMGESEKEEGLYIVVDYSSMDENGYYGMEYCYKENGEVLEYPITQQIGGRAKPVLYLYPTKTTDVKVEFQHPEYLTTTYPKYNSSWKVKASPNGDLIDSNNKYYYGLYWDEIRYNEVDFHEGFYVTKDNAIEFLEEKLNIIGLNARERNEFIMYWLPIIEKNGKSIVYFELTEEREFGNKLIITPTPDSMLRVSIHIKKVNNKVNIKEQKLETFKRYGFSAIEWGGMTY